MSMSQDSKQNAWLEHYQRLLNVEFDWDPVHLSYQPPVEGLPIPITIDMVKKAISQMKTGKAPGPSGIVVEMIQAAGDMGASMIRDLATAIIHDGKVPSDWEQSFIVCLYKGKGDTLERGNYCGLKLTEQVMKILERIVDGLIRQLVSINDSLFGFVPGRGTTDAIFVVRQLQEKYLAANKRLYMAFVDLEKAFDRVPRKVIWSSEKTWCGEVDCANGAGDVCKCAEQCPCWWGVKWGVRSEGCCSPRISTQRTALHHCAWSLIMRVPLWGPLGRPLCWWPCYHCWITWGMCQEAPDMERSIGEERTESKCRKDKDHDLRYRIGPSAEFRIVSMRRLSHWSGQHLHLLQWLQALGAQEMQWAQALEKRPWLQMYTVTENCTPLGWQTTEGSPGRTWQAWDGSFLLLPRRHALSSRWLWTFNHNTCENRLEEVQGSANSSLFTPPLFQNTWPCVQLLCAERNAPCQRDLAIDKAKPLASAAKWQGNDQTDLQCQMQDIVTTKSNELLVRLGIEDLDLILKERRLRWYGHVERSNGRQPLTYRLMESMGLGGPRWHGNSWQRGIAESRSSAINPHDRHTWRSGVRSTMRAASQLSGRGPTGVDVAPVLAY